MCDGAILRRRTLKMAGFEYGVLYLKALSIPEELLKMLDDFALKFPYDLIIREDLLLGTFT